jgi:hypothetical protein
MNINKIRLMLERLEYMIKECDSQYNNIKELTNQLKNEMDIKDIKYIGEIMWVCESARYLDLKDKYDKLIKKGD